ncbi:hypothetical protein EAO71_11655 [Streptomyces sp. ms191]|uniref:hypothetical protein n=1 Tax=unclassified Streptomyces TaxID=2593676 RepID=UPI0011CE760E|nr:hypothetical protein [Streptomyces sp. ms191]TXS29350.1 hypothetical protein EAO71_11655 [Streptomyces sp. ms191]
MRLKRTAVVGAALVALVSVTGCAGAWGEDAGLPKAGDMAGLEKLVGRHALCSDLRAGSDSGAMSRESGDPAWGIEARAVCGNDSRVTLTLLSVADMEKFQQANRKAAAEGAGGRFLLGQDFALVADDRTSAEELKKSGVLLFTCEKDFAIPQGYRHEELLVDGCALTDYLPA